MERKIVFKNNLLAARKMTTGKNHESTGNRSLAKRNNISILQKTKTDKIMLGEIAIWFYPKIQLVNTSDIAQSASSKNTPNVTWHLQIDKNKLR